ncbi:hypothetical protein B0H11DRAFT_1914429 [Mycena galericulata]|nr:hypothetical protein B0H11DRAFT_1914429 [Mycena galericulata]
MDVDPPYSGEWSSEYELARYTYRQLFTYSACYSWMLLHFHDQIALRVTHSPKILTSITDFFHSFESHRKPVLLAIAASRRIQVSEKATTLQYKPVLLAIAALHRIQVSEKETTLQSSLIQQSCLQVAGRASRQPYMLYAGLVIGEKKLARRWRSGREAGGKQVTMTAYTRGWAEPEVPAHFSRYTRK